MMSRELDRVDFKALEDEMANANAGNERRRFGLSTHTEGAEELCGATVGPDATFNLGAPGLEVESWKGGRLVLQVRSADGRRAEGFASVAGFAEITRRAGALAARLLAVLAGTETPADVAAAVPRAS
jgi:hypothetical protein